MVIPNFQALGLKAIYYRDQHPDGDKPYALCPCLSPSLLDVAAAWTNQYLLKLMLPSWALRPCRVAVNTKNKWPRTFINEL